MSGSGGMIPLAEATTVTPDSPASRLCLWPPASTCEVPSNTDVMTCPLASWATPTRVAAAGRTLAVSVAMMLSSLAVMESGVCVSRRPFLSATSIRLPPSDVDDRAWMTTSESGEMIWNWLLWYLILA